MEKLNNNLLQQKLTSLPFRKIAPNIVTTLALCAGVTSMRYAIMGLWGKAIVCIFLAALFDMLDGRVARMLKGSTKFGAELDSLSDFVSFGVAPAIFNTMLEDEPQPVYWQNFFVGVPAPAAAALGILPIMLSFEFPEATFLRSDWFCCVVMCVVAMLMVSRIPTVSTKRMKVPTYLVVPLIIVVVLFATMIISSPWLVLSVSTGLYALSIPVGVLFFLKAKRKAERRI